jgi:hypothetical protein
MRACVCVCMCVCVCVRERERERDRERESKSESGREKHNEWDDEEFKKEIQTSVVTHRMRNVNQDRLKVAY